MQEFFTYADKNPTAFVLAGAGVVVLFVVYKLFDFVKQKPMQQNEEYRVIVQTLNDVGRAMYESASMKKESFDAISAHLERIDNDLERIREDLWNLKKNQ